MKDSISNLHRVLLWASVVLLGVLGLLFLLFPDALISQLEIDGSVRLNGLMRTASSVLLAEAVVVAWAAKSGTWSGTRVVTALLALHFGLETVIRIAIAAMGEGGSLVAAIPQAIIAIGLAYAVATRSQLVA